jgi:enterochelin esterase-like enzyme
MRRILVVAAAAAAALLLVAATLWRAPAGTAVPLRGEVAEGTFVSRATSGVRRYAVYLPPGYADSRTRYPVIYFLHGLPAGPRAYRDIAPIARAVEQAGRRAIVVGVQGARNGDEDPEWLDRGPGRRWETATAVELVQAIDSRYRTIASRRGRVLLGISAGGYGATIIAAHHPETYSVIQSWSGYFHPTTPDGTAPLDLGSGEANDWADFHKQIPVLERRLARYGHATYFGFYVGTDDSRFRRENERVFQELRAARLPHVTFRLYGGAHDWSLWATHAPAWIGRALAVAATPR